MLLECVSKKKAQTPSAARILWLNFSSQTDKLIVSTRLIFGFGTVFKQRAAEYSGAEL